MTVLNSEAAWRAKVETHFKTPYNVFECINVCIIDHQEIIIAVDNEGQVQSVKYPRQSG
jgi:hypothetical protein